jgi:hypothetical protein
MDNYKYILNDGSNVICITEPHNTIYPPFFRVPNGHQIMNKNDIIEYFADITDDKLCVTYINGIKTDYQFDSVYCHYCRSYCDNDMYFYCYDCCANICNKCGIVAHSINNTNDSHSIILRNKEECTLYACDLCNDIILDKFRYTTKKSITDTNTKDICLMCRFTDRGAKYIDNNGLIFITNPINLSINEFGSMLDWVPILRDDDGNMILYNHTLDSSLFDRLALVAIDKYERLGYFLVPKNLTLDIIVTKLKIYQESYQEKSGDESNKFNHRPIKQLMRSMNMPIHYG